MDPLVIILTLATLGCGIGIGRNLMRISEDEIINNTILYMIHNGYIRGKKDHTGEWEILKIHEK